MAPALSRFADEGEMRLPHICRQEGVELAYDFVDGHAPVVVFFPGFGSDMAGTKAVRLAAWCQARGQAVLRFDYAGHGKSGGRFVDGCVGDWAADAAFIIEAVLHRRDMVFVGSSMGGWISLLVGRNLGGQLAGMVLVAPAPDFTELLVRPALTPAQRAQLAAEGMIYEDSAYGAPVPMTAKLLADGALHCVLGAEIPIAAPVRILHGMRDAEVPSALSLRLAERLAGDDVRVVLVKDGAHRLSREADLALLEGLVGEVAGLRV
jgi:pimeloyl-ACP methyl ester carboxylesterase